MQQRGQGEEEGAIAQYVHVGNPVLVAFVALDGPLEGLPQSFPLDEEGEEETVDRADGGPAVLQPVVPVGELQDVPLM